MREKKFSLVVGVCITCLFIAVQAFSGVYLNSSHGNATTGVDRSSLDTNLSAYSVGNCAHCHLQHASLSGNPYTYQDYLLANFGNFAGYQFCTECHDAGGPATDDIDSLYKLPLTIGHGSGNPDANTPVECVECHNPHQAQAPTAGTARGNDATTGSIKGVSGVDVLGGVWPTPGTPSGGNEILASPIFTPIDPITQEWQLCLKCHGGQVAGLTNIAEQINPNNYSAHPVASTNWNNTFLTTNATTALNPPFNVANAPIYCSDCHGSENDASPKGPHGSNNIYMLKLVGPATGKSWAQGPYDALCLDCHDIETASNFGDHPDGRGQHGSDLGCSACHGSNIGVGGRVGSIHGVNYQWPNSSGGDPGLTSFSFLLGGYITELYNDGNNRCASGGTDCGGHSGRTF